MIPAIIELTQKYGGEGLMWTTVTMSPSGAKYNGGYAKPGKMLVGTYNIRAAHQIVVWLAPIDKYYTVSTVESAIKLIRLHFNLFKLFTMFNKLKTMIK